MIPDEISQTADTRTGIRYDRSRHVRFAKCIDEGTAARNLPHQVPVWNHPLAELISNLAMVANHRAFGFRVIQRSYGFAGIRFGQWNDTICSSVADGARRLSSV